MSGEGKTMYETTALRSDRLAAAEARRFVQEAVDDTDLLDADQREVLLLLVSELVTNAVLHTTGSSELTLRLEGDAMWVGVTDDDPHAPSRRPKDDQDSGGFGLWLLDELARDWGTMHRNDIAGKTVWFTLPMRTQAANDDRPDGPPRAAELQH